MNMPSCTHLLLKSIDNRLARILFLLLKARNLPRILKPVADCIDVLRTFEEFLDVGRDIVVDVLHIVIGIAIVVKNVASDVVALVHRRQELVSFVERRFFEDEIRQEARSDHLHFGSVRSEGLFEAKPAVGGQLFDLVAPIVEENVLQSLDLEEPLRVL